jgi:hypothetical protein
LLNLFKYKILKDEQSDYTGNYKTMKTAVRLTCLALLLAGVFSASTTMACTTSAWNGGITGSPAPLAGSPATVSRVSGECAMQLSAAGSVKDTSPDAESAAIIRFYVFAQLSAGTPVIFEAFSDDNATASLLTVSLNGSNFVFDAGDGASDNVPGKSGWNLVELSWTSGVGMDYWVNADSTSVSATGGVSAAAGTMQSVVLGTRDDDVYTGTLTFDDYEAHRSTPVGPQKICDANGDDNFSLSDILAVISEKYGAPPTLAIGQPDCDMDGDVDLSDILATIAVVYPPAP